jgi:hypothetical protein
MSRVLLVIWSLNADGAGAVMTDEFPSMEVCRQAEQSQKGARSGRVVRPIGDLDKVVVELRKNQCEAVNSYMFSCKGRLPSK